MKKADMRHATEVIVYARFRSLCRWVGETRISNDIWFFQWLNPGRPLWAISYGQNADGQWTYLKKVAYSSRQSFCYFEDAWDWQGNNRGKMVVFWVRVNFLNYPNWVIFYRLIEILTNFGPRFSLLSKSRKSEVIQNRNFMVKGLSWITNGEVPKHTSTKQ